LCFQLQSYEMASSANLWVHCNLCMKPGGECPGLHITSCGRVVCSGCLPSLGTARCRNCRGPCNKTIPIDSRAPRSVQALFKNANDELKIAIKNLKWQEEQKASIMAHREKAGLKRAEEARRQQQELERVDAQLKQRKGELARRTQEEAGLKAQLGAALSPGPRQGRPSPAPSPAGSSHIGPALDSSRRSRGSNGSIGSARPCVAQGSGFLQLKTPAAWHRAGRMDPGPGGWPGARR
jgi:hypothetical protein